MLVAVYDNEGNFVDDMTPEEYTEYCELHDLEENVDVTVIDHCDTEIDDDVSFSGAYYDTEYGDNPPSHIYESGMYLGDGVWVSQDFFD